MNVTIGIAYYDAIVPEMMAALLESLPHIPHTVRFALAGGPLIAQNREAIVSDALAAQSDRLLFLDTDIVFPYDAPARLLSWPNPIIGATYHLKRLPLESAAKLPGPDGFLMGRIALAGHPVKAALLPAGFLSLHLPTIVAKLPRPWFTYGYERGDIIGEDTVFCRAALAAGLDLWLDPTIQLKHMGRYPY